ncbi:hypothetical protein [Helicovermis profundi]|uniref:SRPBCC domain-containing protein n=1 Tax=Helicovermis profundi TaxID=3065157 RepID=A0AAU9E1Z7_9FIRM|nr:hypothetical protein HLPR_07220 [Clostridia bacterium S502]
MKNNRRIKRKFRQTIYGNKQEVMTLLCPVREREWLNGWNYKMIYSESGFAEKGCIFETDNDFGSYKWVMTKYDINDYKIQFVKFIQDEMIVIIDIDLLDNDEKMIYCDITYTFTAINDNVIDKMHQDNREESFEEHMKLWENSMNYYLKNGSMLK